MKIEDLCAVFSAERFPAVGTDAQPDRGAVLAARSAITAAVIDDEFLADCISCELHRIEGNQLYGGLVPFFTVPGTGVRLAFGYWPPGGTPGPHEHTAWTITAVCRNELEVVTYDREKSYRQRELVRKNCFQAPAGRVGYIYEPSIHAPRNNSSDWSLSFHAISPRDGEPLTDHDECLPDLLMLGDSLLDDADPYASVVRERQKQRFVQQLSRVINSLDFPAAPRLLAKCFELASSPTRRGIERLSRYRRPSAGESSWRLRRAHKDLVLSHRRVGNVVALYAHTLTGPVEELVISREATDAIGFAVKEPHFEVHHLSGDLTTEEKTAIAEALEESGLFIRMDTSHDGSAE
jgi:hypothetical protein